MTGIQEIKFAYTYRHIQNWPEASELRDELYASGPTHWHLSFDQCLRHAIEEVNAEAVEWWDDVDAAFLPIPAVTVIEDAELVEDEYGNASYTLTLPWNEDESIVVYRLDLTD